MFLRPPTGAICSGFHRDETNVRVKCVHGDTTLLPIAGPGFLICHQELYLQPLIPLCRGCDCSSVIRQSSRLDRCANRINHLNKPKGTEWFEHKSTETYSGLERNLSTSSTILKMNSL
ncbi:hypothetical protein ElyMa_000819900 [Elysia marginata]|uniref:Uncharacterized protein n=1 Tax=Elysia marginata TaxID=1093978 RepID=A0AAV4GYE2_9GAST|nr:hypothetical protein ElyMa_000819900 [Elysia marginata]